MGQAKKRGSFEERQQQSFNRAVEDQLKRAELQRQRTAEAQARYDAMSPDEKQAYATALLRRRSNWAAIGAMATIGGSYF